VELSYPLSTLCILFSLFPLFFRVHVGADPEEIIKVGKAKTEEEEKILAAEITAAVTVLSLFPRNSRVLIILRSSWAAAASVGAWQR
jgi:hypothetical protein